jgi:hypothetical protein
MAIDARTDRDKWIALHCVRKVFMDWNSAGKLREIETGKTIIFHPFDTNYIYKFFDTKRGVHELIDRFDSGELNWLFSENAYAAYRAKLAKMLRKD